MAENIKPVQTKPEYVKPQEKREERLVRILSKDIEGKMKIYVGLTKIKGVSWAFSNAVCKILKIDKNKTIGSLTDKEIQEISDFIKNPELLLICCTESIVDFILLDIIEASSSFLHILTFSISFCPVFPYKEFIPNL